MSQVDEQVHKQRMIDEIIDHEKSNGAINNQEDFKGTGRKLQTTKGWKLYIQWNDGSSSWMPLRDTKNGYPVEIQ